MQFIRSSIISGKTTTMDIEVTSEEMDAYLTGALIQDAFPNLSAGEREFLMTGITPAEWEATFAEYERKYTCKKHASPVLMQYRFTGKPQEYVCPVCHPE